MKIETTPLDVVWIGMITGAVLYLVLRTVATLERMSQKVDSMVDHVGSEVESAINRLSKEANHIIHNFEKNAFGYKEHLFQHVQDMELQCYRTKNGIFAMGFGHKSPKRKYQPSDSSRSMSLEHNSESPAHRLASSTVASNAPAQAAGSGTESGTGTSTTPSKKGGGKQLVAIHKCVERILKAKYKKFFIKRHKSSKHATSSSAATTTITATSLAPSH